MPLDLRDHLDDLISNDLIYDTVVGVAGISTEYYDASRDLSSGRYLLEEGSAVTLEGKRRWAEAGNVGCYQRENLQRLVDFSVLSAEGFHTSYYRLRCDGSSRGLPAEDRENL